MGQFNMIKIGTPFITTKNDRAELHAPVTITGDRRRDCMVFSAI